MIPLDDRKSINLNEKSSNDQITQGGLEATTPGLMSVDRTAFFEKNPQLTWNGLQPLLWRIAAFQEKGLAEKLMREGLTEFQEFFARFGLHEPGLQPSIPRFVPGSAEFTYQSSWSEETKALWALTRASSAMATLVPGSARDFISIKPGAIEDQKIWTYNLGGCSALVLGYQRADQSRDLLLLHYHLTHLEPLRQRLFGMLHELKLIGRSRGPACALLL